MARPRKPYGQPPGRLPATMIKVLAAELSESGRLGRGKHLWATDSVIDIVVGRGTVTAEVQGTRREPYVVTIETEPGDGMPHKSDLWATCTCPDDDRASGYACKHVVAALFALSDEVAIEPELLQRWRSGRTRGRQAADVSRPVEAPDAALDDGATSAALTGAGPSTRPRTRPGGDTGATDFARDPSLAEIGALLAAPAGFSTPTFPTHDVLSHPPIADRLWGDVLIDALARLEIAWS